MSQAHTRGFRNTWQFGKNWSNHLTGPSKSDEKRSKNLNGFSELSEVPTSAERPMCPLYTITMFQCHFFEDVSFLKKIFNSLSSVLWSQCILSQCRASDVAANFRWYGDSEIFSQSLTGHNFGDPSCFLQFDVKFREVLTVQGCFSELWSWARDRPVVPSLKNLWESNRCAEFRPEVEPSKEQWFHTAQTNVLEVLCNIYATLVHSSYSLTSAWIDLCFSINICER